MFDDRVEGLIEKFLDDALNAAEREELQSLFSSDPAIRRRLDDDATVRLLLENAAPAQFSENFADGVLRSIAQERNLAEFLSAHKAKGFRSGYAERVARAIEAERLEKDRFFSREVSDGLRDLFPKFATPVAAAASLAMVANANAATAGAPLLDALFGLPSDEASEVSFFVIG